MFRILPNLEGHLKFFCGARGQKLLACTCLTLSSHMSFDFAQLFPHSSQMPFYSSTITIDAWEDCVTRWENTKLIWEHSTNTWEQPVIIWEQPQHSWERQILEIINTPICRVIAPMPCLFPPTLFAFFGWHVPKFGYILPRFGSNP